MRKVVIILVLVALAFGGWKMFGSSGPVVEVTHPVRGPAVSAVYATGTVEATVMMPIAPRSSARLMELHADEGSRVTKGEVLAQLEDNDLRHSITELLAREALAQKTHERSAALLKKGFATRQTYDEAKAALDTAIAAREAAQAQAEYLKLQAPADGEVIRRDGEIGQLISANQPVFWLSCCAPLRISAEVDEEDISQVQPGQEVLIRADAFPGQVFNGRVQAVTPKGDPVARSYRVRVTFDETAALKIGMTAETNIILSKTDDALLVPSTSVSQNKVWLVRDGKLVRQPVTTGARGPEQTEVKEGVAEGDLVVVRHVPTLKEGQSVRTSLVETKTP